VHTVIDDHSRVACTGVDDDETAVIAVAVLHHAVEWLADRAVTVERVCRTTMVVCFSVRVRLGGGDQTTSVRSCRACRRAR
jgi:hypothetical protein